MDLLNAAAILGLLISYLAPYVDPLDFWPISFFGLTFKFWLVLNIGLLLLWIFLRKKRWMYNGLFLLLGYSFIARNIQFNSPKPLPEDFKVATFNTAVQQIFSEGNTSESIDKYLAENKVDVAVLIEWLDKKGKISKKHFPHQQFAELYAYRNQYNYGLKLVSKHKILHWERIKYNHITNNLAAFFDIEIKGTVVRFVAVHLQSNGISSKDYHKLVNVELDDEYKEYALDFVKSLKVPIQRRSIQTKTVLEAIENSPYPVVILGDFNDTPQSFTYQQLKQGRKDAFIEKGSGWGATYLKPFPMLRIDYILHDDELSCTSYKCTREIRSDHALVQASFKIKE